MHPVPGLPSGRAGHQVSVNAVVMLLAAWLMLPGVAAGGAPTARDAAEQAERLQQLRDRIAGLKDELGSLRGQQHTLQAELEKTEKQIGVIAAAMHDLERKISHSRQQLQELAERRERQHGVLQRLRAALTRDLRSAYTLGRQEQVKLLLNQEDPAAISRMLVYHRYFGNARSERIGEIRTVMADLALLEQSLGEEQDRLEGLRARRQEEAQHLTGERARRSRVLAGLQSGLQEKSDELKSLERDEQQLQSLVQSLQRALARLAPSGARNAALPSLKGKLSWPVPGTIRMQYGDRQGAGKPPARGILLDVRAGTEVRAIARGQVAFADWLRGFGLLLIIDHGGGYMSLYGHNRGLFKQPGDSVDAGEVIASVGDSGGELHAGLYLELRKDGRPFNPAPWFAGKPSPQQAGR
jgi:septal ring factor EnvC (AmiA/AmiB activator)